MITYKENLYQNFRFLGVKKKTYAQSNVQSTYIVPSVVIVLIHVSKKEKRRN